MLPPLISWQPRNCLIFFFLSKFFVIIIFNASMKITGCLCYSCGWAWPAMCKLIQLNWKQKRTICSMELSGPFWDVNCRSNYEYRPKEQQWKLAHMTNILTNHNLQIEVRGCSCLNKFPRVMARKINNVEQSYIIHHTDCKMTTREIVALLWSCWFCFTWSLLGLSLMFDSRIY